MVKYMSVCLPVEILKMVDEKIKGRPYTSRADFVKQSIRHEFERLDKNDRRRLA